MLFPAAFLVVLILTGICVDTALVFLGQREIANAANAAVNDAVSGLDINSYYVAGDYRIAEALAQSLAQQSFDKTSTAQVRNISPLSTRILTETTVELTLTGEVPLLFARAFPFISSNVNVHASATAQAKERAP